MVVRTFCGGKDLAEACEGEEGCPMDIHGPRGSYREDIEVYDNNVQRA